MPGIISGLVTRVITTEVTALSWLETAVILKSGESLKALLEDLTLWRVKQR